MRKTHFLDNGDFIDLVCQLSDYPVEEKFGAAAYKEEPDGGTSFTEEAQDYFNEVYDEIETLLNQFGVFSDNEIMFNKEEIIKIINEWGVTSTADINAAMSPSLSNSENNHVLIERFNGETVTAVSYVHEMVIAEDEIHLDNLPNETIIEIHELLLDYAAQCVLNQKDN